MTWQGQVHPQQVCRYAKLSGAGDTPEGRDAIQRHPDKLEKWACVNLARFNKAKCKVLHLGQGNARYQYRLGDEGIENSPAEKDLGYWWMKSYLKQCGQQVEGGDSAPLVHSGETSPGVLRPALELPAQDRHGPVGMGPEKATKMI